MDLGSVIEIVVGEEPLLAMVTGRVGKKLVVLTEDGRTMRPAGSWVSFVFEETADASDPDEAREHLRRLADAVATAEVDLKTVWERADAEETYDLEGLAAVADIVSDVDHVALQRQLRNDETFFRHRRRGWQARTAEQVEESCRRRRARREEAERRHDFVRRLAPSLEERTEFDVDPRDQPLFEALETYAILGPRDPEHRRVEALLDDLEDELGYPLRGVHAERAFWILVEIGVFDAHTDLELLRFRREREEHADHASEVREHTSTAWEPGEHRRDMTDWWTCTIDDPESADLDDALSVRPRIDGGWEVAVHIADPSEWVAPGSELDRFARFASTSLYLPTGVEPMLPPELSERVMSLNEGHPRPAMTTQFSFSKHLEVESVELFRSTVSVDARLDYNTVDAVLLGVPHPDLPTDKLTALRFIADEFHMRRMESGAVTLKLPEVKLRIDRGIEGPRVELAERSDSPSRSLIQEWMVAANVAAARYCSANEIPAFYRVQEPPDGDLEDAEILAIPPGVAREFARLKRMRRGEASLEPGPHSGLGVESYIQVTSPIRRYMDLVMQRQIAAHLEERPLPYTYDELEQLRSEIERSVFEARKIEQNARKYWMIYALGQADGPIEAEVIDLRGSWTDEVSVFLTNYGYRAECGLKESAELGEVVQLDVTRAEPRKGALSLRKARPG